MKVLIVGAGGHGQVVADILLAQRAAGHDVDVVGYLDDDAALQGAERLGIRVIGPLRVRSTIPHDAVIVAVGDNTRRARLTRELTGATALIARHPSAVVASEAAIGDGSMICARAVVGCASRIGRGVILNTGCTVDHHAQIEDFVHVAPGVHLGGNVSIGQEALVGIGAVVLPGVSIGRGAIVGAGAVVTRDVADRTTVVGVPAAGLRARAVASR